MVKKTRQMKRKKHVPAPLSQFDKYFDLAGYQILQKDYDEAVATCESLLSYLPQRARQRAEVLDLLGTAQTMLQNFPQSYAAYTQALALAPEDAVLWFNRGMASRFTSRFGKSLCDYERALQLNSNPELRKKMEQELALARSLAEQSRKLRGPNFTLAQLIEQEDFFQNGMLLMENGKWQEGEQHFRAAIAMGDCLPQPWGNLGLSLIMQKRYDEAETALQRALEIDPHYTLAKENLRTLPTIRQTGVLPRIDIHDPFKSNKLKQSITFLNE
jgi:tetratricopeptide (TPR) repeat protein